MLPDLTLAGDQDTLLLPAGALLSAELTYSQRQTTNLLVTVVDTDDYAAVKAITGQVDEKTECKLGDLKLRPDTFTVGSTGDAPVFELSFKVSSIAALEQRTGGHSWGSTDVSAWAKAEIRAVGAEPLVQHGLGEREIERKEPEGDHQKPESSHDVLAEMAKQVGAWYFDTGQHVVLARPSWLVSQPGMPKYEVAWNSWRDHSPALLAPPVYRVDYNARPWEGRETLTLTVTDDSDTGPAHKSRPGHILNYTGKAAPADPVWVITEVQVPDHHDQPVTLTCWRPVDPPEIVPDTGGGEGAGEAGVPTGPIGKGGWAGEQLEHAAEIVREGQRRNLGKSAYQIAVATAMGESSLRNIGYGDAAGPDSTGLFQQRDNWGSRSDRMTPSKAAGFFYDALTKTDWKTTLANGGPSVVYGGSYGGSEAANASLTIHNVQRNADPGHYVRFWEDAKLVVQACLDAASNRGGGAKATGPLGEAIDKSMAKYEGRSVDVDGAYGAQCVDVVAAYITDLFGIPMVRGNGKDYWRHPDLMGKFTPVPATQAPRKGDVVAWSGSTGAYQNGSYGHVAIYSHSERGQHFFLTQNPGPARVMPLSSSGILGWMRPIRDK